MAFPRKDLFSAKDQALSNCAQALSHPARISILRELQANGGMYAHEIEHVIPLSIGAVSDHLARLRKIEFVSVESHGRYNYYTLNLPVLAEADLKFNTMFSTLYGMSGKVRKTTTRYPESVIG